MIMEGDDGGVATTTTVATAATAETEIVEPKTVPSHRAPEAAPNATRRPAPPEDTTTAQLPQPQRPQQNNKTNNNHPKQPPRRSVSYGNVEIQEYDMILGDHPGVVQGPPISIDWVPVRQHSLSVDDYESGWQSDDHAPNKEEEDNNNDNNNNEKEDDLRPRRRRGLELRMPDTVRQQVLEVHQYSAQTLRTVQQQGQQIRAQRRRSHALEDLDGLTALLESAGRKYARWKQRRLQHKKTTKTSSNATDDTEIMGQDPAQVWLDHYKRTLHENAARSGAGAESSKIHVSWHGSTPRGNNDDDDGATNAGGTRLSPSSPHGTDASKRRTQSLRHVKSMAL